MNVTFRKSNEIVFSEAPPRPAQQSHFADFQLLNKGAGETVLLSIEGRGEQLERRVRGGGRHRDTAQDKIVWQLGADTQHSHKEIPPKNVVKDRLKNFEWGGDNNLRPGGATPTADQNQDLSLTSDTEEAAPRPGKKMEHKRSVKDLLSDFERKSKALQEEEKEHKGGIGSFLLKDTRDGGQRRVCSDTETMHFATSSDDDDEDFYDCSLDRKMNSLVRQENNAAKSPGKSDANKAAAPAPPADEAKDRVAAAEETYLAMTPSRTAAMSPKMTMSPKMSMSPKVAMSPLHHKHHASSLLSVTSLTSSHGSSQSITSPQLRRFSVEAAEAGDHNRTPSQTLVMEHFHPEMPLPAAVKTEEETYVDMNEDGTRINMATRPREKEPILSRDHNHKEDNLDNTLTFDPDESPRYCEIDERHGAVSPDPPPVHYELLSNARSASKPPPVHYEALYHEIAEAPASVAASTPTKTRDPPPLRPIEGLPDILGNAPTNKGNSSSDADDESSKDFDAIETKTRQTITLDDSFRPASFYLSRCKSGSQECDDDSSDSDLVSPPPVPSSPPPMEEVLGFTSSNNFQNVNFSEGMNNNVFAAARSSSALRERSRRDSHGESPIHPSVEPKTSYMTHQAKDSPQSNNRESAKSPQRLHGSHQSLSSRELPPIPHQQNLQGSQQSLASKEIQQIGSRHQQSSENIFRNSVTSPYHSREGSLDNEAFLFHKFTQGTSISDYYKRGSDSAELSSSDTANYEQEYRRYHLENIQEVSHTLERSESGTVLDTGTSIISQELNISYNSVYDSRLQKKVGEQDKPQQQAQKFFQPDPRSKEIESEIEQQNLSRANQVQSPRSKIPYYMSDIMEDGTIIQRPLNHDDIRPGGTSETGGHGEAPSLGVVDAITKSMNALDVESRSYFEEKNAKENERIKMLRRSYTPDPYLAKVQSPVLAATQGDTVAEGSSVVRSKSLEGLLGDSQGGPKDNLGYARPPLMSPSLAGEEGAGSQPQPRSRRGPPPPPPAGVPPLDITPLASAPLRPPPPPAQDEAEQVEDEVWAASLRRAGASIRQRAKSIDSLEEAQGRARTPSVTKQGPPTAPKPKTPVHMLHHTAAAAAGSHTSYTGQGHTMRTQPVIDYQHSGYQHYTQPSPALYQQQHQQHPQQYQQHPQQYQHQPPRNLQHHPQHYPQQHPQQHQQHQYQQQHPQQHLQQQHPQHQYPQQHAAPWQQQRPGSTPGHQTPVQRNSVASRQENFLSSGLPSTSPSTSDGPRQPQRPRSVSRPASRGPAVPAPGASPDWVGRPGHPAPAPGSGARSMTLPARIKYSQDSLPRGLGESGDTSFSASETENSPRTRTSKSGLHEDSEPVPPSPAPPQQNIIQNNFPDPSFSSHKDLTSHPNYRGTLGCPDNADTLALEKTHLN